MLAGDAAEDEEVGERVAAEPIGSVHTGGAFSSREKALDARLLRLGVDSDAAHRVVRRRPDLHRLLGDVDVAELFELVIHRRKLALDVLGASPRVNVEKDAAVRAPAPGLDLAWMARATMSRGKRSGVRRAFDALPDVLSRSHWSASSSVLAVSFA
jgi:hypothetical protein